MGVGHPMKISTPTFMLLNFVENEMLLNEVVQMCFHCFTIHTLCKSEMVLLVI